MNPASAKTVHQAPSRVSIGGPTSGHVSRRGVLAAASAVAAGAWLTPTVSHAAPPRSPKEPFLYCLNTSTIREPRKPILDVVKLAAAAGYHSIEPWIDELRQHVADGHSLADLRKRIADLGLTVESAIGFATWIVDDEEQRKKGLEDARRDMDLVRQIGGARIAAPPIGAHDRKGPPPPALADIARRYRALLEIGHDIGVVPQLEVWGFSPTLSRLGETLYAAAEAEHPQACVLPDIYHLHKGGNGLESLQFLAGRAVHCFHVNDYPSDPPRETISDQHRVYPGDGIAPVSEILRMMYATGFRGALSLELFNRDYWKQDPAAVCRTGVEKIRAAVLAANLDA
jgi:sugar phosphate isomerase/epimerase